MTNTSNLYINLKLENPLFSKSNTFKNLFCFEPLISKHKAFCFEIVFYPRNLIEFELSILFSGRDHAGPRLEIGIFGLSFAIQMYDTRHWDYENDCWMVYNDQQSSSDE